MSMRCHYEEILLTGYGLNDFESALVGQMVTWTHEEPVTSSFDDVT